MYLMLFGLLCLCFVSFGGTAKLSGGRRSTRQKSEEDDLMKALFSMFDGQILLDNVITLPECLQAWSQQDSNNDDIISKEELAVTFEKLDVAPSSGVKLLFEQFFFEPKDIEYETPFWFFYFDKNDDETISESEFEIGFKLWYGIYTTK